MIRKLLIYMIFLTSLNGCVQGIAFVGPLISYSQSGNALQAGLSYGSNHALKKIRSTKPPKNKKNTFVSNKAISYDY